MSKMSDLHIEMQASKGELMEYGLIDPPPRICGVCDAAIAAEMYWDGTRFVCIDCEETTDA